MAALLLTNQILSLPAEAADRLLNAANGDAALFYLAFSGLLTLLFHLLEKKLSYYKVT